MITREQESIIYETLRGDSSPSNSHYHYAVAMTARIVKALGGVEPLVIDGWVIEGTQARLPSCGYVIQWRITNLTISWGDSDKCQIHQGTLDAVRIPHINNSEVILSAEGGDFLVQAGSSGYYISMLGGGKRLTISYAVLVMIRKAAA